jgi:pre-mRNA-splicing factor 38A
MANLTDPLIRSLQGTDPQNLMEYITRQKIYDSRFWKEDCFGLTTADVLEKAAQSLKNVGGTFGPIRKPTKFLCLVLKLLQLQPDMELVRTFVHQDHFKYLRALGAFYLRLTGRPQDIYDLLEPMYADYSKLRYRDVNEWTVLHMDEFIDELLTKSTVCGIALPRLPARSTLVEAGYVDEAPSFDGTSLLRPTALLDVLEEAGGVKAYLELKMRKELDLRSGQQAASLSAGDATTMWELRYGDGSGGPGRSAVANSSQAQNDNGRFIGGEEGRDHASMEIESSASKRKSQSDVDRTTEKKARKGFGTLFTKLPSSAAKDVVVGSGGHKLHDVQGQPEEGSEEYWNEERAKLGLKPLKR